MFFYKIYCRVFQFILRIASNFLGWRTPELIEGERAATKLPEKIKPITSSVLVVTDGSIRKQGLLDDMLAALEASNIKATVYDGVVPNPTLTNVAEAESMYKSNSCGAIIAFGGGSPMDCAKAVGARISNPNKSIPQMKGLLKVSKKLPPLFAVPTTAGTGSETTLAAVISDHEKNEKYALEDPKLIPLYAVLDPVLTKGLPPKVTSTTGIDALSHAVEAYIGHSNTNATKKSAETAVKLVFENLETAYKDGSNLTARENMQVAAFEAGLAFTRAYVGNVHAIAHTLGGFYNMPHGLAIAIVLPHVLEYYGAAAHTSLSALSISAGIGKATNSPDENAKLFISAIKELNKSMDIPEKSDAIKDEDIPQMVEHAFEEANPVYPVPVIFSKEDFTKLYKIIKA